MNKQFVPYEIALKLKELGFEDPCIACYTFPISPELPILTGHYVNKFKEFYNSKLKEINVAAPLWQQAIDFFREKYDLHISFEPVYKPKQFTNLMYCYSISTKENFYKGINDNLDNWLSLNDGGNMFHITNSYYSAREQAILKAIELIKKT